MTSNAVSTTNIDVKNYVTEIKIKKPRCFDFTTNIKSSRRASISE